MWYKVDSELMRIGRWSKPRLVFVCQLVEVVRTLLEQIDFLSFFGFMCLYIYVCVFLCIVICIHSFYSAHILYL